MIRTRSATPQDADLLVTLMAEFHAESGFALNADDARRAFLRLLAHPELGGVWLADSSGEAAGYIVLTLRYSMDHGAFAAHVEDLFVRPSHRRQGAGSALLSALIGDCRQRQCRSIHVEVGNGNFSAIALYGKFGLQKHEDGRLLLHGDPAASNGGVRADWLTG